MSLVRISQWNREKKEVSLELIVSAGCNPQQDAYRMRRGAGKRRGERQEERKRSEVECSTSMKCFRAIAGRAQVLLPEALWVLLEVTQTFSPVTHRSLASQTKQTANGTPQLLEKPSPVARCPLVL